MLMEKMMSMEKQIKQLESSEKETNHLLRKYEESALREIVFLKKQNVQQERDIQKLVKIRSMRANQNGNYSNKSAPDKEFINAAGLTESRIIGHNAEKSHRCLFLEFPTGFYLNYFAPKHRDDINRGVILSGKLDIRPPETVKADDSTSIHVLDTEKEQGSRNVQPLKVKVNGKCKDSEGCITVTSAEVEQGEGLEIILHVKTSYSQNKNPLDLPDKDDTTSITEEEEPRGSQLSDTDRDSCKDSENSEESEEETSKIDSTLVRNSPNPGCFMNLFGKKLNSLQYKKSTDKGIVMSKGDHSDKQNPIDIPVEFLECPDIVTSALEAEFKHSQDGRLYQQDLVIDCKEEKKDENDGESGGEIDLPCVFSNTGDPYSGLVATETCSTSL